MMNKLLKRGEEIARTAQQRTIASIAIQLKEIIRGATVTAEETEIIVSGRDLLKRWLIDPTLRFLSGGLK